jgi:hypothetical protein
MELVHHAQPSDQVNAGQEILGQNEHNMGAHRPAEAPNKDF